MSRVTSQPSNLRLAPSVRLFHLLLFNIPSTRDSQGSVMAGFTILSRKYCRCSVQLLFIAKFPEPWVQNLKNIAFTASVVSQPGYVYSSSCTKLFWCVVKNNVGESEYTARHIFFSFRTFQTPPFLPPMPPTQGWFLFSVTPNYALRKKVTSGEAIPPVFSSVRFYFYRHCVILCQNPHRQALFWEPKHSTSSACGLYASQDILADW